MFNCYNIDLQLMNCFRHSYSFLQVTVKIRYAVFRFTALAFIIFAVANSAITIEFWVVNYFQ